ncbi:MAG: electron transport complex protein RnfC [Dethiosulfovibrio peptidovorans]|nr:MAG: electron transport complex protein RnfC [Dethiosulfovibrio peptidovorans]
MTQLLDDIQSAGIVGAGGAGFPTHVKFAQPCEYILLNGAECEPLLQVDQQIASTYTGKLMETMERLVEVIKAKGGIFALKAKYHDAMKAIETALPGHPTLCSHSLPNVYPAGDEQILVYEVLKRIVPEGGIPLAVDVVVLNMETLFNVGEAMEGHPVVDKFLTVNGEIHRPTTVRVPMGVSFAQVVDSCGGATIDNWVALDGGPMMGRLVINPDEPVTKTTKGILILPRDHPLVISKGRRIDEMMRLAKIACCHCMLCTDVCPRYLLGHKLHPDKLMRLAAYNRTCEKDVTATEAFLCCECGLCEIACIMGLQPWKLNRELKTKMAAVGIKNPHDDRPKAINPFRDFRGFPTSKLIHRLGLSAYAQKKAPLDEMLTVKGTSVTLLLKQHIGTPAKPQVSPGDRVHRGQLVAQGEGVVSAHVHSSVDGIVRSVTDKAIVVDR